MQIIVKVVILIGKQALLILLNIKNALIKFDNLYVKNVVDNSSYLYPNSDSSIPSYVPDEQRKYYKYNVGAGLRDTIKIAELAAADNNINAEFTYYSRALSFSNIKNDIRNELPVAAWLSKNGAGSSDHIVMFNGARTTSSNSEQVRVYDPGQGGQAWVLYDDLIDGTCSALKNRIYDSTVYCE